MTRSFTEYLAGRRHSYTAWGDWCRYEMERGTMPNFETWQELRAFMERRPDLGIDFNDARSTWDSYRVMLQKARRNETLGRGGMLGPLPPID